MKPISDKLAITNSSSPSLNHIISPLARIFNGLLPMDESAPTLE